MAEVQRRETKQKGTGYTVTFGALDSIADTIQKLFITKEHHVNLVLEDHSASCTDSGMKRANTGGKLRGCFRIQARDKARTGVAEASGEAMGRERGSLFLLKYFSSKSPDAAQIYHRL